MLVLIAVLIFLNLLVNGYVAYRLFPTKEEQQPPQWLEPVEPIVSEPLTPKQRATLNPPHLGRGPFSSTVGFKG